MYYLKQTLSSHSKNSIGTNRTFSSQFSIGVIGICKFKTQISEGWLVDKNEIVEHPAYIQYA